MNKENILSEGILDWISRMIIGGKTRQVSRRFKKDKNVLKLVTRINKNYSELSKLLKDMGVDMKSKKIKIK